MTRLSPMRAAYPSVLILASRAQEDLSRRAPDLIDDPDQIFAASSYLRLEVIPRAAFQKKVDQVAFFERYFQALSVWADENGLVEAALREASTYGLHALDALHIAAAARTGAEFHHRRESTEAHVSHQVSQGDLLRIMRGAAAGRIAAAVAIALALKRLLPAGTAEPSRVLR